MVSILKLCFCITKFWQKRYRHISGHETCINMFIHKFPSRRREPTTSKRGIWETNPTIGWGIWTQFWPEGGGDLNHSIFKRKVKCSGFARGCGVRVKVSSWSMHAYCMFLRVDFAQCLNCRHIIYILRCYCGYYRKAVHHIPMQQQTFKSRMQTRRF